MYPPQKEKRKKGKEIKSIIERQFRVVTKLKFILFELVCGIHRLGLRTDE
jgi:hypothetical protein